MEQPPSLEENQAVKKIIAAPNDIVGLAALGNFLLSRSQDERLASVWSIIDQIDDNQSAIYRNAAFQSIQDYMKKKVDSDVEKARQNLASSVYNDLVKDGFENIIKNQEDRFEILSEQLARKTSILKQISVAIAAAIGFGIIIYVSANMLANPVQPVIDAIEQKSVS